MRAPRLHDEHHGERGITLVEILIALVVLSIGIMAVSSVFPTGTRAQVQARDLGDATYFALQKIEDVKAIPWTDPALSTGRHPAGVVCDTLGDSKAFTRFYNVDVMPAPMTDLKRVIVTVNWIYLNGTRSVTDTTYVRK